MFILAFIISFIRRPLYITPESIPYIPPMDNKREYVPVVKLLRPSLDTDNPRVQNINQLY